MTALVMREERNMKKKKNKNKKIVINIKQRSELEESRHQTHEKNGQLVGRKKSLHTLWQDYWNNVTFWKN